MFTTFGPRLLPGVKRTLRPSNLVQGGLGAGAGAAFTEAEYSGYSPLTGNMRDPSAPEFLAATGINTLAGALLPSAVRNARRPVHIFAAGAPLIASTPVIHYTNKAINDPHVRKMRASVEETLANIERTTGGVADSTGEVNRAASNLADAVGYIQNISGRVDEQVEQTILNNMTPEGEEPNPILKQVKDTFSQLQTHLDLDNKDSVLRLRRDAVDHQKAISKRVEELAEGVGDKLNRGGTNLKQLGISGGAGLLGYLLANESLKTMTPAGITEDEKRRMEARRRLAGVGVGGGLAVLTQLAQQKKLPQWLNPPQ